MSDYHIGGKLDDCERHGPQSDSELFVVEGDSAARAVSRVRSLQSQAVLPMQGKPMNAIKASEQALKNNAQYAALMAALGIRIGSEFNLLSSRYERIILLFDPDADGIHARTLMLLFFHKWMKPLLDAGRIYDVHVPRWEINSDHLEGSRFASTDEQFRRIRQQLTNDGVENFNTTLFRGIGSVGADTLTRFCVDPETRTLFRLRSKDAESAIRIFAELRQLKSDL
jgi:DNA gyrase subunit B